MRHCCQWLAVFCLMVHTCVLIAAESKDSVNHPARSFGYTIGDVLEQRISLKHAVDNEQWQDQIPLQRINVWIERISATIVDDEQRLVLRYQIVNAPTELVVTNLPALEFSVANEEKIIIESWPFSIAPLIPAESEQTSGLPQAQADWQPIKPDSLAAESTFKLLVTALLISLLAWFFWWLWQNRSDAVHLPFARAYQELRKLDRQSVNETQEAWVLMHRAFNRTAGRTISTGSVDEFVIEFSWLQHLSPSIHDFYKESAARFFAESSQTEPFDLLRLCKILFQAEKQSVSGLKPISNKVMLSK